MRVDDLVVLPGTVRARTPEETWAAAAGLLPEFGLTRLADLTGLDCIGPPVWTAVRPASLTLSTSQGKGATPLLAKLSAVMEAIELWHLEQPLLVAARGPAAEVPPPLPRGRAADDRPLPRAHPAPDGVGVDPGHGPGERTRPATPGRPRPMPGTQARVEPGPAARDQHRPGLREHTG